MQLGSELHRAWGRRKTSDRRSSHRACTCGLLDMKDGLYLRVYDTLQQNPEQLPAAFHSDFKFENSRRLSFVPLHVRMEKTSSARSRLARAAIVADRAGKCDRRRQRGSSEAQEQYYYFLGTGTSVERRSNEANARHCTGCKGSKRKLVGAGGFEPPTSCTPSKRAKPSCATPRLKMRARIWGSAHTATLLSPFTVRVKSLPLTCRVLHAPS
jgi:hypothetical protein